MLRDRFRYSNNLRILEWLVLVAGILEVGSSIYLWISYGWVLGVLFLSTGVSSFGLSYACSVLVRLVEEAGPPPTVLHPKRTITNNRPIEKTTRLDDSSD